MWIVRLALARPYTFIVLAMVIVLLTPVVLMRTPTDIFPEINIPVISLVWTYTGLQPHEMEQRITSNVERGLTTLVNDVEHIESQSLNGIAVIKVFFQPHANIQTALAQTTAISQTFLRFLPPGTTPPLVIIYSASTVPVIQIGFTSDTPREQQLFHFGTYFIRTQLATVPGAATPFPYGGKQRVVSVDIDPTALQAKGLSAVDIVNAVNAQNLILPTGTAKLGSLEYNVEMNGSPQSVEELNDLPVKTVNGATIYMKDVAHIRDGFSPPTNIVLSNGQRGVLMSIYKTGSASTIDIVDRVKQMLEYNKSALPEGLHISTFFDQSLYVRASIQGVIREGIIAACLTAVMILLFLGNWKSTLIIAVSIPLSILVSILCLSALGETINIMTLGGLALAVGILVDDATVEIENINRNLAMGKETVQAILDGAQQIAVPAFVSTLSICIVFVPMFFLSGVARYLFVPLAEAVCFAMLASYFLSRTVVPTMAKYLLRGHEAEAGHASGDKRNLFVRLQFRFEEGFERFRERYHFLLERCLHHQRLFLIGFFAACVVSLAFLVPWLGQDFFPAVDSGQFKLHLRARTGTRIEETARLCDLVEQSIREQIPADEVSSIIDNIGFPYSGINLSYSTSAPVGPADADILVSLSDHHHSTDKYVHDLRIRLADEFPSVTFSFLPADIVSQILNFGLPSPIDIQIVGANLEANRQFADRLLQQIRYVPGTVDLRIQQPFDQPKLHVNVDRTKAGQIGFTERDVASNLLISLSGSFQTSPTFWLNPKNGVSYAIATQTPQYRIDSLQSLENIPINNGGGVPTQILGSLAAINRGVGLGVVSHYDIQPVIDIYGSVQGRDLGGVARDLNKIIDASRKDLPRGTQLVVRGQIRTMRSSYVGLLGGLVFSILLVYLLIVVNFQSWLDPFIIISALPAALAGIAWFLFVTRTTLSVPALTGSIMCMGVATANSILVVSFAKEQLAEGKDALSAALEAGFTRFRPVLMTAMAMMIGMVPMAMGLGEGGEQNAPLGRAVIGGLLLATVSTLFFVPTFFSLLHGRRAKSAEAQND